MYYSDRSCLDRLHSPVIFRVGATSKGRRCINAFTKGPLHISTPGSHFANSTAGHPDGESLMLVCLSYLHKGSTCTLSLAFFVFAKVLFLTWFYRPLHLCLFNINCFCLFVNGPLTENTRFIQIYQWQVSRLSTVYIPRVLTVVYEIKRLYNASLRFFY